MNNLAVSYLTGKFSFKSQPTSQREKSSAAQQTPGRIILKHTSLTEHAHPWYRNVHSQAHDPQNERRIEAERLDRIEPKVVAKAAKPLPEYASDSNYKYSTKGGEELSLQVQLQAQ